MNKETAILSPDRQELMRMISACWSTKVIGEGVHFGVFDQLAEGAKSASDIAATAGVQTDGLHRVMRALAVLGLLQQTDERTFALTAIGQTLRRDHPDSLSGMAQHWSGRLWDGFTELGKVVETGEPSVESGPEHFAGMQNNDPVQSDIFNRAMAETTLKVGGVVAGAYDFSRFEAVMDVGGGYGALLIGILDAHPRLKGFVFDLEGLGEPGKRYRSELGKGDAIAFLPGSFFETVPAKADCLLLKYIIHDWGDEHSRTILRNCREAIDGNGVVLLVERIVPDVVEPAPGNVSVIQGDLVMLRVGGKERTESEYRTLLGEAGLELTGIFPTDTEFSVIEAKRA